MLYNYIDNDYYKPQSVNCNRDWFVIYHFCEPVKNDKD